MFVHFAPRDDAYIHLLSLCRQLSKVPPFTAVLGLASDGAPLLLRLPGSNAAHVLIAGDAGSGKCELAQTILLSLSLAHRRSHLMFVLMDPGRRAFGHLSRLPHLLQPVLWDVNDAAIALRELVRLVESRERAQASAPRIVVIIDELAGLAQAAGVPDALAQLTQRGHKMGIHVIARASTPLVELSGLLEMVNFPVRLVGRVGSAQEACAAAGMGGSGAETLAGRGDFVAVAAGAVTRFRAAGLSPTEVNRVVKRLNSGWRGWDVERETPGGVGGVQDVLRAALYTLRLTSTVRHL